MKPVAITIAACFALGGCAQSTFWLKNGGTQEEFNRTQASCHNEAYFLPRAQTPQSQPSYRITANVSPYGQVNATATPFKAPYQALGDGLNSMADAFDNIARHETFIRNCMLANGWRQATASDISLTVDTYARVGINPTVDYDGKATGYLDGAGTINITSRDNNQCVGTFKYNEMRTAGTGIVRCDDGDSAEISFSPINKTSGFGGGVSAGGKPIRFVYGVPYDKREPFLFMNTDKATTPTPSK